jgi:hypothetical protein
LREEEEEEEEVVVVAARGRKCREQNQAVYYGV